jgi:hypothetical protein
MHCLGQAFKHKLQPLHFSELILIVGIINNYKIFLQSMSNLQRRVNEAQRNDLAFAEF